MLHIKQTFVKYGIFFNELIHVISSSFVSEHVSTYFTGNLTILILYSYLISWFHLKVFSKMTNFYNLGGCWVISSIWWKVSWCPYIWDHILQTLSAQSFLRIFFWMHTFNVLQRNWKSIFYRGIEFAYICCVWHIVCYGSAVLLLQPLCYFLCSIYFKLIISQHLLPQYQSFCTCSIAHVFHWSYLSTLISLVLSQCYFISLILFQYLIIPLVLFQ